MNLEKAAREIAEEASKCRLGDGFEKEIEALALLKLKEAYNLAIEEAANTLRNNTTGTWCDNYVYMIRKLKK